MDLQYENVIKYVQVPVGLDLLEFFVHRSLIFLLIDRPYMILDIDDMMQSIRIWFEECINLVIEIILFRQDFNTIHDIAEIILRHCWEEMMFNLVIEEDEPPVVEDVGGHIGRMKESEFHPVFSIVCDRGVGVVEGEWWGEVETHEGFCKHVGPESNCVEGHNKMRY